MVACISVALAACEDADDALDLGASPGELSIVGASVTTPEDTPVAGQLLLTGSSGHTSVAVEQPPEHGTLVMTMGTEFRYTPAPDYVGTDSAVVVVRDSGREVRGAVTMTITAVNDPPAIVGTLTVAEDSALRIDVDTVSMVDPDSDPSTFTLTLLGGGSDYTATGNLLRPPPNFFGTLTARVLLGDGVSTTVASVPVIVTPVNDPPVNTVPLPQRTAVDTAFVFDDAAPVTVDDIDAGASPLLVTLTADAGTLTLASQDGLGFEAGTGVDDPSVTFRGRLEAVNAALHGLVVTPPPAFNGIITIILHTDDQGATGAGGALVAENDFIVGVGAVDLPPFITAPNTANVDEDATLVLGAATAISVIDVDADVDVDLVSITLSVTAGTLDLASTTGLAFITGSGTGDATVTFGGTFANANAALDGLRFVPSPDYAGSATLSVSATSNALTDTTTVAITVHAVNDAPVLVAPTAAISAPNDTPYPLAGAEAVSFTDVDAAGGVMRLTLTASNGGVALASTSGVSVVSSTSTQIVLDGTSAALNAVLSGLSFVPTTGYVGGATLAVTINDNGNTGAAGPLSASASIAFTLFLQNDPPNAVADSYSTSGNTELVVPAAGGVMANDTDPDGTVAGVVPGVISTTLGGTVTLAADGGFTYLPPVGVGDASTPVTDGFSYTLLDNDGGSASGTVALHLGRVIWYVDSAGSGDGRSSSAFATLAAAVAAAQSGEAIYVVAGTYTGSVTVPSGVELVGSGAVFDRGPNGSIPVGTPPTIQGTSTAVITLSNGSAVRGIRIAPAGDPGYPAIVISGVSGVTVDSVEIRKHAPGISVSNSSVSITSSTIADTAGDAISIDRSTSGTSNVALTGVRIEATRFGNGVLARVSGGGALNLTADDLTTRLIDTNGIDVAASGSGSFVSFEMVASHLVNDSVASVGDTGVRIVATGDGAVAAFDIADSTFDAWMGAALSAEASDAGAALRGRFQANTILSSVTLTYLQAAIAITADAVAASGSATGTLDIRGNQVTVAADGGPALDLRTRDGASHVFDATVIANQLVSPDSDAFAFTGNTGADLCLDLSGNTASSTVVGYDVASGGGTLTLPGLTGGAQAFIANNNTGTAVFTGSAVAGSPCAAVP